MINKVLFFKYFNSVVDNYFNNAFPVTSFTTIIINIIVNNDFSSLYFSNISVVNRYFAT